ncbi:hypothetical protein Vafri_721 [Volvox africanus]|nr:hypothetical protein Vafri_721 [Volvox africanus]
MSRLRILSVLFSVLVQLSCWKGGEGAQGDFCRPELPGCCPKVVDHVLLLHIEKTGGTSLRTFLQAAVKRRFQQGAICNYLRYMPYQCLPSSESGGNTSCNARNFRYYEEAISSGSHFKRSCKLTSSHHDFRIIDALPPHVRNTTLLIVNLREPASRAVSHFYMLRRHQDPGAINSTILDYFLGNPVGMSISRNRMTRVLAGEFCCKDGAPVLYDKRGLLELALARLDQFCVVGLTSRVQDTMLYVQHALGLGTERTPKNLHYHNNAKKYEPVDELVLQRMREANALDVVLFKEAERRFNLQMKSIGRGASGEAGNSDSPQGSQQGV